MDINRFYRQYLSINFFARGISLFCTNDVPDNSFGSRHPVSSLRFTSSNWVSILDSTIDIENRNSFPFVG